MVLPQGKLSTWLLRVLLWGGALGSFVGLRLLTHAGIHWGWDLEVYRQAMKSLSDGLDPYAIGQARQMAEHAQGRIGWTYVYPPITIVILRLLNYIPSLLGWLLFWTVSAAGFGCQLWAGCHLARPSERKILQCLLPLAVFYPAFMPNGFLTVLSGNIAIPIYGAVWVGVIRGWKQGRWGWFYTSVLVASLFKLPMLTLLAIPVLMRTAEIVNSALIAACGVSQFLLQRLIWPKEFAAYLSSVQMQFTLNHDFGFSAAGVLGHSLDAMGKPFATASAVFYLIYGALIFVVLAKLARMYHRKQLQENSWMTVLMFGAILLNPRIMEYDALAVAVPMVLLVFRGLRDAVNRWYLLAAGAATACAGLAEQEYAGREMLMALVFTVGVYGLLREARSTSVAPFPQAAAAPVGF